MKAWQFFMLFSVIYLAPTVSKKVGVVIGALALVLALWFVV